MKIILILKIIIGTISLILGTIGIILPLLPTTPFILLSIACFSSTPKIKNKLLKIKFIHEYYNSYHFGQGLKKKTVIKSLVFLWCALGVSGFISQKLWIGLILLLVGLAVTWHILYIAKRRSCDKNPETD